MHASKFTKFKLIVRDARVFPGIWFDFIYPHNSSLFFATVFIRISAQPRISAHLEKAPILKAEKVNKRPASNKRPPLPNPTPTQTEIGAQPLTPTTPQKGISTNNRLARRRSFLQSVLQKPCFVTSSRFVITIYCFLAKYTYYTC